MGIFSTLFKCFETENTTNPSFRTSSTIYMTLSQRITQVGKDPYLLELSELHQIGVHAWPSPRRSTLLLAPSRTDGPNGLKSREKELFLSLKSQKPTSCPKFQPLHVLVSFHLEKKITICFCLIIIKLSINSQCVLFLDF